MTTQCPCPHPPGGSVTCEGKQFAYCHVVDGEVQSGCIPIPSTQRGRPAENEMLRLLVQVLESGDFPMYSLSRLSIALPPEFPSRDRLIRMNTNANLFLFESMLEGNPVTLVDEAARQFRGPWPMMLLLRFPGIWSRFSSEPNDSTLAAR